ncbi:glycosyl transferase [Betaproteobacteria bacterium]|nr:glycosyl transferase [Betaproteobacteria bacterium]GHU11491.1 glycosyl transferase [Betaproteobacteria bacterium]GHU17776.1 glycosyl transferase [Betaproteobacteria bacterium]
MLFDPQSQSVSTFQRRAYGTVGLALLVGFYLLAGLLGHEPWRGDDARHFGPVYSMLRGEGLLFPLIGGQPFTDYPPLYYWCATSFAFLFGAVFDAPGGARLASAFFTALTVWWVARAAEHLHGRPARTPAALLTLGSLGLVLPAHETQPLLALMAMVALVLEGISRIPLRPVGGGLQAGLGCALAFLAGGLTGLILTVPLFLVAMMLSTECRNARASSALIAGLALATTLTVLWPLALHLTMPDVLVNWLRLGWRQIGARGLELSSLPRFIELLGWFLWPLWPIALWALWRNRGQLVLLRWMLPLASALIALLLQLVSNNHSPPAALPLLPAVALLAAGGLSSLRRGAANAFDWFAAMTFGVFAILVWLAWSAQVFAWPPGLARYVAKTAPSFVHTDAPWQAVIGAGICLFWLVLAWRLPKSQGRASANWAMGMTMLWCLAVTLLMPWFDHTRTYQPMMAEIRHTLTPYQKECVASTELTSPVRSMLDYYVGIRPVFVADGTTPCRVLLIHVEGKDAEPVSLQGWEPIGDFHRGGGKQYEAFHLYLRSDGD